MMRGDTQRAFIDFLQGRNKVNKKFIQILFPPFK